MIYQLCLAMMSAVGCITGKSAYNSKLYIKYSGGGKKQASITGEVQR